MAFRRQEYWEGTEKDAMAYLDRNVRIRLTDPDRIPVENGRCRNADAPDIIYKTDKKGLVVIPVQDNWQEKLLLQWEASTSLEGTNENPFYWRGVFDLTLTDFTDDEACKARLIHLGFQGENLNAQVTAYQTYFNQEVTGDISTIKNEMIRWHDGGTRPGTDTGSSDQIDTWVADLKTAFDSGLFGWGTDEEGVYIVLREAQGQMAELTAHYNTTFPGKPPLDEELFKEFSGDERKTALRLYYGFDEAASYQPNVENQEWASQLKDAFENGLFGWGTDEDQLFSVLESAGSKLQIGELAALYNQLYGRSLEDDLFKELSGDDLKKALQIFYCGHSLSNSSMSSGGWISTSECEPDGTLAPENGDLQLIRIMVRDSKGSAVVPADVEMLFGSISLAVGSVDGSGTCEFMVPESRGISLRITNIDESNLEEGDGPGTGLVETAYQLSQGVQCALDAVVVVTVALMDLTFTFEKKLESVETRFATLELSDGSYSSTLPLPMPSEDSLEQEVIFKGIPTLNKRYTLFVDEAGVTNLIFSDIDLGEINKLIDNSQPEPAPESIAS